MIYKTHRKRKARCTETNQKIMLKHYIEGLFRTSLPGDAREESFYSDLKKLLEDWIKEQDGKQKVTTLPKKTEGGNPDFRVWDGKSKIVGYIEAKDPRIENLELIQSTEQLTRYRRTFPNLILTNFFEFRLYRNGELIKIVSIGRPFIMHKLKIAPPVENELDFFDLLSQFFSFSVQKTTTAKALATELAKRTHFLRDSVIAETLLEGKIAGVQTLEAFYDAFKQHLITSLTQKEFSDLFAQTVTYGLFAARSRANGEFNRKVAFDFIPPTVGILRDIFRLISSADLPKQMMWIIDDIAEVLAEADVKKIIHGFFGTSRGRDPVVHFYETFLSEYDPTLREKRGVYYTPEPVVSFMTRSVHSLLKEKFGKEDGFADCSVTVLDPAAGTLTFPTAAIELAVAEFKKKYGEGGVHELIKRHILKDFFAFELMMAPYAVGHMKMGFVFDELGYRLEQNERFQLFLTNTLDFSKEDPNRIPGILEQSLAKESAEALKVKETLPIMVVLGNPPYSGISENKGEWITEKIEDYKMVDGKPLGERKHWLQDDYVKFFRFAQWKIEQSGQGVLGFITNHAWLDNPTFRGMRSSMLETFDELYILNLHGSTLKKDRTPSGGKDENVFDIQPGVAIVLLVKKQKSNKKSVFHADLWGLRQEKYDWLDSHSVTDTEWQALKPSSPYYFFVKRDERGSEVYEQFHKITDIFPVNSTGILTGRDDFVIDFDKESLLARIRIFADQSNADEFIKEAYKLKDKPAYKWFIKESRKEIAELNDIEKPLSKIFYRPFDLRWIYYHPSVIFWPREGVMHHLLQTNTALVVCRQLSGEGFRHAFISDTFTDDCYVSNKSKERGYVFPLYLYGPASQKQSSLFNENNISNHGKRSSNISIEFFALLNQAYNPQKVTVPLEQQKAFDLPPEDILNYIYAVLYSNVFRKKYSEFLKIDFPRIPFTKNYLLFNKVADLGERLIQLHLLKSIHADNYKAAQLSGKDHGSVEKVEWKSNEVWINNKQQFTPVPHEAWEYMIGGYQVLNKWLKDRKGRVLSLDEVKTYCRIIAVIRSTIEIQKEIDILYPKIEKDLI